MCVCVSVYESIRVCRSLLLARNGSARRSFLFMYRRSIVKSFTIMGWILFFLVFESMQLNVNVLKIIVKSNQSGDVFRSLYGILFFVLSTLINRRKVFEASKSIE